MSRNTIALGITGASGAPYGLRLLECLIHAGEQVSVMISQPAQVVSLPVSMFTSGNVSITCACWIGGR